MAEVKAPGEAPSEADSVRIVRPAEMSLSVRELVLKNILTGVALNRSVSSQDSVDSAVLPTSEVVEEWRACLAKSVPASGWLAAWRPGTAEERTSEAEVTTIVVDVVSVQWATFGAQVVVMQVGDQPETQEEEEEEEEESLRVPLLELYVLHDEDKPKQELEVAAYAMDQFRFFFRYLWRPWDEDDDSDDWLEEHLAHRMALYSEYKALGHKSPAWVKTSALGRDYRRLLDAMGQIQIHLDDSEAREDEVLASVSELEHKKSDIKREADILENSPLRAARQAQKIIAIRESRPLDARYCFVVRGEAHLTYQSLRHILEAEAIDDDTVLQFCAQGDEALEQALMGDTILFTPGNHNITELQELRLGGVLAGLGESADTVIMSSVHYDPHDLAHLQVSQATLVNAS